MTTHSTINLQPRLIVLLPEVMAGDGEFAQWIHRMAAISEKDVLFLTILDNPENYLTVSRGLATMKAVAESNLIRATSVQVPAERWFKKLQEIARPEDVIVCHTEQQVKQGFKKSISMTEFLAQNIRLQVTTVGGYYHPQRAAAVGWLHAIVFWIGAALILAGFTYLEIETGAFIPGLASKLVLFIILAFEFGAVWAWTRINNR